MNSKQTIEAKVIDTNHRLRGWMNVDVEFTRTCRSRSSTTARPTPTQTGRRLDVHGRETREDGHTRRRPPLDHPRRPHRPRRLNITHHKELNGTPPTP